MLFIQVIRMLPKKQIAKVTALVAIKPYLVHTDAYQNDCIIFKKQYASHRMPQVWQ